MSRATASSVAILLLAFAATPVATPAQEAPPASPPATAPQEAPASRPSRPYIRLQWPEDDKTVVAKVGDREITLGEVLRHQQDNHAPQLLGLMALPAGDLYFDSPWISQWVRWYADIVVLEETAKKRGMTREDAQPFLANQLKDAFQSHLDRYAQDLQRRGLATELTQDRVNRLLDSYQRERGLQTERDGWLDFLEPAEATEQDLYEFYRLEPWFFGAQVECSHILIATRDPKTGILLEPSRARAARSRLEDVLARLKEAPESFPDVARMFSQDIRTANQEGDLGGLPRFGSRMPTEVLRAVWALEDGAISEPIHSPMGIHILKRRERVMQQFILYTPKIHDRVERVRRQYLQENVLFKARAALGVELLY